MDSAEELTLFILGLTLPLALAMNGGALDSVFRGEVSIVILWGGALALVFGLIPRSRVATLRTPLAALAGLVAWTALSMTWSESAERGYAEVGRVVGYAGLCAFAILAINRENWRSAGTGLCVAILSLPLISILSRLAPGWFDEGFVIDPERLAYPLEYWNGLASWSAMAISVGLVLSAHLRRSQWRAIALAAVPVTGCALYLTYSRGGLVAAAVGLLSVFVLSKDRPRLIAHAAVAATATAVVILVIRSQPAIANGTGGEGGWVVGIALVLACMGCGHLAGRPRRKTRSKRTNTRTDTRTNRTHSRRKLAIYVTAISLGAIAVAWGSGLLGAASEEFTSSGYPELGDDGASRLISLEGSRDEIWSSALSGFASDPLRGIGAGSFEYWYARDAPDAERVRDAHSLPLETLAELGLPGLLLLVAFLGGVGITAVRSVVTSSSSSGSGIRAALLAAFAVFVSHSTIDWLWESTAVASIGTLAGICAAASMSTVRKADIRRVNAVRYAMALVAVTGGVLLVPSIVSTERYRAALSASAIGREDEALESADEAIAAQPWAATPYALRSVIYLGLGRFFDSAEDAREAIDREPTNWRHRVLLARALSGAGNEEGVQRALDAAIRLGAPPPQS